MSATAATAVGTMGIEAKPEPKVICTGRIEPTELPLVSRKARRFMPPLR